MGEKRRTTTKQQQVAKKKIQIVPQIVPQSQPYVAEQTTYNHSYHSHLKHTNFLQAFNIYQY